MCTRRRRIHVGLTNGPVLISDRELAINSFVTVHWNVLNILDIDAGLWMLTNIKTFLWPQVCLHEQILDTFVVDLYHRDCNTALNSFGGISLKAFNTFENLVAGPRHNSFVFTIAYNRIALS